MVGGFELAHTTPFHDAVTGVVDGEAGSVAEQGASESGEDGLAQLRLLQLFDFAGNVEAGRCGYRVLDDTLLQGRQLVVERHGAAGHAQHKGFRHPMVAQDMVAVAGKTMTTGCRHIVVQGVGVEMGEERESRFVQPDRSLFMPPTDIQDLEPTKHCPVS